MTKPINFFLNPYQQKSVMDDQYATRSVVPGNAGSLAQNFLSADGHSQYATPADQFVSVEVVSLSGSIIDSNGYYKVDKRDAWFGTIPDLHCYMRLNSDEDLEEGQTVYCCFEGMVYGSPDPLDDGLLLLKPMTVGNASPKLICNTNTPSNSCSVTAISVPVINVFTDTGIFIGSDGDGNKGLYLNFSGFSGVKTTVSHIECIDGLLTMFQIDETYVDGILKSVSDPYDTSLCTTCACPTIETECCENGIPEELNAIFTLSDVSDVVTSLFTFTMVYDGGLVHNFYSGAPITGCWYARQTCGEGETASIIDFYIGCDTSFPPVPTFNYDIVINPDTVDGHIGPTYFAEFTCSPFAGSITPGFNVEVAALCDPTTVNCAFSVTE